MVGNKISGMEEMLVIISLMQRKRDKEMKTCRRQSVWRTKISQHRQQMEQEK